MPPCSPSWLNFWMSWTKGVTSFMFSYLIQSSSKQHQFKMHSKNIRAASVQSAVTGCETTAKSTCLLFRVAFTAVTVYLEPRYWPCGPGTGSVCCAAEMDFKIASAHPKPQGHDFCPCATGLSFGAIVHDGSLCYSGCVGSGAVFQGCCTSVFVCNTWSTTPVWKIGIDFLVQASCCKGFCSPICLWRFYHPLLIRVWFTSIPASTRQKLTHSKNWVVSPNVCLSVCRKRGLNGTF